MYDIQSDICKKKMFLFQAMLQYLDKLQAEDLENLIKKKEIQRALMKEVAKANEVTEPHPLGYTSHPPPGGSDRIF